MILQKFRSCKKIFIALLLIGAIVGTGALYYVFNDGLITFYTKSDFTHRDDWEVAEPSPGEQAKINAILDQKFSYLDRGVQTYAYASSDGKYVLKIVKQWRFRLPPWQDYPLRLLGFKEKRKELVATREKREQLFLSSCKIAYEELQKETGILYLHLKRTEGRHKPITIIGRLGKSHTLDLDNIEFILQKRAELIGPAIDRFIKEGNEKKAEQQIARLISFLVGISKKGIAETDKRLMINAGFIDEQPIFIDIGAFARNEQLKEREAYQKDVMRRTLPLKAWLESHHPSLLPALEQQLENIE